MPGHAIGVGETAVIKNGREYMPFWLHILVNVETQPTVREVLSGNEWEFKEGAREGDVDEWLC